MPSPRSLGPRAATLIAVALLLLAAVVLGVRTASVDVERGPVDRPAPVDLPHPSEPPGARAVRVLEEWQAARARAYFSGEVGALRRLYARGSSAGRRDVAVLRAWTERGIGLDLVTDTSRLAVLTARPHVVVLRQRARVRAVAQVAGERRVLPGGAWGWRRVTLREADGRWVLSSAVRGPGGSPREPP